LKDVEFGERFLGFGRTGEFLRFKDAVNQPQDAKYIFEAFKRVGITFSGLPEPNFADPERVEVVIGTHP
jgi:hypothetical protein